jgi:hypothetical protein
MEKSKLQEIKNQFADVWKQFQPGEASSNLPPNDGAIVKDVAVSSDSITKVSEISKRDLFTELSGPISRLNLPKVNVDPWSAFWLVLATMVGGTGLTSYLLLIAVPPTPSCQGIAPLSSDGERLYCAQVGAETREVPKIRTAVNLVKDWTEGHPLYGEAQRLLTVWSQDLTKIGRKQLNSGEIQQAISTLRVIPPTSPTYAKTQELIAKWSDQAQDSASIDAKFEQSIKLGDWNGAFGILQSVQRMRGSYWNTHKHEQMSFKLAQERDAWDKLQEAKDAIEGKEFSSYTVGARRSDLEVNKPGKGKDKKEEVVPLPTEPAPIVKAMELANQINPKTYVYQQGQTLRSAWSQQLVKLTVDRYKAQNFNEAIAIAQKVPYDVAAYPEAQDWVKLNQASVSAGKRHILALMDAVTQTKRIQKTSPIYTLAKGKQANWQGLLKQQTQLQWAKTIASFQQPATLALAIETAKQVPAQSEEGKSLQSEISNWSRQIETVDNRVILAKATQIVANGATLVNLKAAVHLAGKISKDRPMGEEATTAVAGWTEKIQTIEDRPILENAQALAKQGQLSKAIEVGNRIAPGRALYHDMQADVRYWSLELQEIADRRTLAQAIGTYRRGNISNAIALAASIGRRSPVYGESRSYVADWRLLLAPRMVEPRTVTPRMVTPRTIGNRWVENNSEN